MSGEPVPQALTYAQVAAMVGKSVSTVEKWVSNRNIPFHREGRNVRFDPLEIRQWLEDNEFTGDNRIQPVRPLRRGGAQYVYPSQTLGDEEHCWCGDRIGHDWEGKTRGAPHPHDHQGRQQVVMVEQRSERVPDWKRVERGALRGYHAVLKAFLIKCINTDGLSWKPDQNAINVYPPDGTPPMTVRCQNNNSQMRTLDAWYNAHVKPFIDDVDEGTVVALAEKVNDPEEHPARKPVPQPTWQPYVHTDGEVSEFFETDNATIRCRLCVGTGTAYETPYTEVRGLGGHVRMVHRDAENLRTPEALAKATDSKRYNRLLEQVQVAVELLAETVGFTGTTEKVERLEHALEKERRRADAAEERLRKMQEAFRGLE